jgi:hypothetical protein
VWQSTQPSLHHDAAGALQRLEEPQQQQPRRHCGRRSELEIAVAVFATVFSVAVPLDHEAQQSPQVELMYELGAPFDAAKPTVILVTDGQQFRVAPGRMRAEQAELLGDGFNVVGIYGRGATAAFQAAARANDGSIDWPRALAIFRAQQWVDDIEAVRGHLLGREGRVSLYGTSGGALLVHQYLARHGRHVRFAFTSATVEPWVARSLRLRTDRFWDEISSDDRVRLERALASGATDRSLAMALLQRQNFFVPLERLPDERAGLIRALEANDQARLAQLREAYQVDAVRHLMQSPRGVAIRVREYEFAAAGHEDSLLERPGVYPDLEVEVAAARPLLDLLATGRVSAPVFDTRAAHALDTEVFVLAGHGDHTADWRASITVAARYPRGILFVADDNHRFDRMRASGAYMGLLRAFLAGGSASGEFRAALEGAEGHRWRE